MSQRKLSNKNGNKQNDDDYTRYTPISNKGFSFWKEIERATDGESDSPRNFLLIILIICITSTGSWFLYNWLNPRENNILPVLKPENAVYRVVPENRGGIEVPHQDKMIYDNISPQEKLIAPEEKYQIAQPIITPQIHHNPIKEPSQKPQQNQAVETIKEQTNPIHESNNKLTTAQIEPQTSVSAKSKEEEIINSSIEDDIYLIQVGIFKTSRIAHRELNNLKKRYGRMLADYDLEVLPMKRGRYRISVGPFYSKTQALSIAMRIGNRSRVVKE